MDEPRNNGDETRKVMPEGKRFQAGNPGRPKGSRNKLGEHFIQDVYADWQEHGVATIAKMRQERPHEYVKVVASILPKEVKIERMDDLNDDDLAKRIRQLASDIGIAVSFLEGTGSTADGTEAPETAH